MINSIIDFTCPNCNSKKYIGKTSIGKKYKEEQKLERIERYKLQIESRQNRKKMKARQY